MPQNTDFKNGSSSLLQVDHHAVCEAGRLILVSTKNMKSLNITPATVCINNLYKAGILFAVYRKTARRTEVDVVPVKRPIIPHVLECLVLFCPVSQKNVYFRFKPTTNAASNLSHHS
jgi:hypothetical protein